MKILIEIDTDTQRVVPVFISEEMHIAAFKVLLRATGIDGTPQRMLDAICAAAPQPEPVDVDLRRDAERYLFLRDKWWFCGVGDYLVRTALTAEELDSAIDAAILQGERK